MHLPVLIVFVCCTAATFAQSVFGGGGTLGEFGSNVGKRIGSGIGGGFGSAFDAGLGLTNIFRPRPGVSTGPYRPVPPPIPTRPRRPGGERGYYRDDRYGGREYDTGTGASGRRGYERQGSGGAYEKGASYNREKSVNEREQGTRYEGGRSGQGSARGGSSDDYKTYGRDKSQYGDKYDGGYTNGNGFA